jgi:hypothetical protein
MVLKALLRVVPDRSLNEQGRNFCVVLLADIAGQLQCGIRILAARRRHQNAFQIGRLLAGRA